MQELTIAECWAFLSEHEFGRLGFVVDGGADITPINYAVDEGQIIFRTAMGGKFAGALGEAKVAFEVDQVDPDEATSVVLRGPAVELEAAEARVSQLRLRPWTGWSEESKPHLVAIRAEHISGRRYPLHRPWKRMMRD